ncbi:hypothetical protein J6P92_05105 [bacterium]|nr:hypothetical protein [bacterium]
MGKSKNRLIYRGDNKEFLSFSRIEAIKRTIEMLKNNDKCVYEIITLFGLSAEELLENGANYELIKGLENVLK